MSDEHLTPQRHGVPTSLLNALNSLLLFIHPAAKPPNFNLKGNSVTEPIAQSAATSYPLCTNALTANLTNTATSR